MRDSYCFFTPDFWFFRILGYGLLCKNTDKHPLLFSERNGYRKGLLIGKWRFNLLRPESKGGAA